jgi:hypothetical protein
VKRAAVCLIGLITLFSACAAHGASNDSALAAAFAGGQSIDLRTCQVSSVVTLRDKVGIPPSSTPVLVKVFDRKSLPDVLRSTFARPGVAGVTINGRYIAILRTELHDEYADILRHELVHAYISLASPAPLPLWFQEGSAVHYSMGKDRKFYGQPAKDRPGVMLGKTVVLPNSYQQKLQTFNYVLQKVGEKEFNAWYKQAVLTGNVDPRSLLGLPDTQAAPAAAKRRSASWMYALLGVAVVGVLVAAYFASRRGADYF